MSAADDLPPCPEFVAACERGDVFQRSPRPLGPDGFTPLVSETVENARRAEQAERRAEDAEAEVERLRERVERTLRLIDSWEHDAPDHSNPVFIGRLRECLRRDPAPVRLRGGQR